MTKCLCDSRAADRTGLRSGTSRRSAGGMTESFAFGCATDRAGLCYGTSCIIPSMSESFAFGCTADRAGLGGCTSCILPGMTKCSCDSRAADRTGLRSGTSRRRAGGVSLSSNYSLCYNNCVTYRTVLTFGKTGFGTGRSYCRIDHFSVSKLCNSFGLGATASCASVGLYTFFSTSRRFGNNTAIVAVAECRDYIRCVTVTAL